MLQSYMRAMWQSRTICVLKTCAIFYLSRIESATFVNDGPLFTLAAITLVQVVPFVFGFKCLSQNGKKGESSNSTSEANIVIEQRQLESVENCSDYRLNKQQKYFNSGTTSRSAITTTFKLNVRNSIPRQTKKSF